MIDFEKELQAILADDPLGLLEVKPAASNGVTADERLVAAFEEINAFVETHGREPTASRDIQERKLYSRLQGLREDTDKMAALLPLDRFELLHSECPPIPSLSPAGGEGSIEEERRDSCSLTPCGGGLGWGVIPQGLSIERVMDEDPLGLLDTSDNIFKLQHVTAGERASADFIAKRKPCKNFAAYEADFIQVQQELKAGKRRLLRFNDKGEQLVAGAYYVLSGILLKLEAIHFTSEEKTVAGKRFRKDGRTYCVFENGTESNMLYRSLAKALYQDGKIVSNSHAQIQQDFAANFAGFTDALGEEDTATGFIYVLRSLSADERIRSIPHLHKIGFSRQPVATRLKHAAQEPTYLLADVEVIAEYQVGNVNPQKLELLLHRFFAEACLNLDVFDGAGKRYTPREWFVVPLPVLDQAIRLLLNGQILNYAYNPECQELVLRQSAQSGAL